MLAFLGVSLKEIVILAGIGMPTALLSIAVALWFEARSARTAADAADIPNHTS
jgi:hypothetical protein